MGTVTFLFPGGSKNWPRNYVIGFALPPVVSLVQVVGTTLTFQQPAFLHKWVLEIRPEVFARSSNIYSTDFVFDESNCFFYVNNVPTLNALNLFVGYAPGERELRLCLATEFGFEPANYYDWGVPSGPWPPHDLP